MSPVDVIADYAKDIQDQFNTGHAKEHAYRPALKQLISRVKAIV